jgi:hypothetical protein
MMTEKEAKELAEYYENNEPKIVSPLSDKERKELEASALKWKTNEEDNKVNLFKLRKIRKSA